MIKMTEQGYLEGKMLIAMPDTKDQRFEKSVVLMLHHSENGAIGVIINRIMAMVKIVSSESNKQFELKPGTSMRLHFGGPVENERSIVIHSGDSPQYEESFDVAENINVTMSTDILDDLSKGISPQEILFAMGYAGWGPGQLEGELQGNAWLICDANQALVFNSDDEGKWEAALKLIGINPSMLTSTGGCA